MTLRGIFRFFSNSFYFFDFALKPFSLSHRIDFLGYIGDVVADHIEIKHVKLDEDDRYLSDVNSGLNYCLNIREKLEEK